MSRPHPSIRTRLLVSFLLVAFVAATGLALYFLNELEAYGLRKLEERLDAEARLVAALLAADYVEEGRGALAERAPESLALRLRQVGPEIASRVRVLDARGVAVADSAGPGGAGLRYAEKPEVLRAMFGRYGTASRVTQAGRTALYIAVPIRVGEKVVGVSYVSSTTFSILTLLRDYRVTLAAVVVFFLLATLMLAELLVRWLSRPLYALAEGAAAFAAGDHSARVRPAGAKETRAVAEAFNKMAEETERVVVELREEERRKSRFVSDVSHELRTPLTAIRGAAETLLDGDVPPEDAQRFLATIGSEAERLSRLANDLIILQRIEGATGELPLRRMPLSEPVRRAADALGPVLEERGVTIELTGEGGWVLGDRDRIQQVVANLVDNASRMMPEGGTVHVTLGTADAWTWVRIADEGPGIAEQDVPHVFDRFWRAEASRTRARGGSGLGLAIVKAIVTAHAGTISVENAAEGGAAFTVRLPAAPAGENDAA